MSRSEFPLSVRKAALKRSNGICECGCGQPFTDHPKERPHYDHALPDFLGGTNDLENCQVLRVACHQVKTYGKDMGQIVKVRREEKRRLGLERKKSSFATSRDGKFKQKIGGEIVRR